MTSHQINSIETTQSHLGMKWYNFQKNFALIVGAVCNFIYSVGYLTGSVYFIETNGLVTGEQVYEFYGHALQALDIIFGLFMLGFAVFALILKGKLADFDHDTLTYVYIFYSLYAGVPLLYILIGSAITAQFPAASTIASAVVGLIFLFVNIRYFRKRAHLFIDKEPVTEHIATEDFTPHKAAIPAETTDAEQKQIIQPIVDPIPATLPQKPVKHKYCSRCGSLIDNETKVCTGCGKKYFRGIKLTPLSITVIVMALLLASALSICIWECVGLVKLRNEVAALKAEEERKDAIIQRLADNRDDLMEEINQLKKERNNLNNFVSENSEKVNFFDNYVEIIGDDGSYKYHKWDCPRLDLSEGFYVLNTEYAEYDGFERCPYCH